MLVSRYKVLHQTERERIHNTALKVLETVGVKVDSLPAIKLLQSAGAIVETDNSVKLPTSLVEKAIEVCNPRFSIYHRQNRELFDINISLRQNR